jgi:hypothetical protein
VASTSVAGSRESSPQTAIERVRAFTQLPFRTVSVASTGPASGKEVAYDRTSLSSSTSGPAPIRIDCDVSSAVGGSSAMVQESVVSTPGFTGSGVASNATIATFEQSPPPGRPNGRVTASPEPLSIWLT